VEKLTVERFELHPGLIVAHVRNAGPDTLTVAQVSINDSIWPATASPSNVIPRLGTAAIALGFPWIEGEAYSLKLMTSNAIAFTAAIPVATMTPQPTLATLGSFTLIGLYVGVIPIALGLLWYPALRHARGVVMHGLLAMTAGVLVVLGVDTLAESLEQAQLVPGPLQGLVLVAVGAVGVFLLVQGVAQQGAQGERSAAAKRLGIAYTIALGIGLHNLGEGLAIGAAYAVGEIALGTFLVVGFMVQNVTEGIAIVAPLLRERPRVKHLIWMGLLAGVPTIAGTWLGGFSYSAAAAALFLAMGAGAIAQVLLEVVRLLVGPERSSRPFVTFGGVAVGMLILYVTGLLIK
jgi:zinc transporter ZupT